MLVSALLAGCSERDIMTFSLEQSLKIALESQCQDDAECLAALEAQLGPCIENHEDIDELIAAGGQDDELSQRVVVDIARCVTDENGVSYFYSNLDAEYSDPELDAVEYDVRAYSPGIIPK